MLFDVRVTAFDPQAAVDPVEALMRLFKIERSFAREVVHRLPRVIKRGVPLETAQRLTQVLERIGAQVEILVSERTQVGAPAEKPRSERKDSMATDPQQLVGTPRVTVGRGLPPPAAAAVAQTPTASAAQTLQTQQPALARRSIPNARQRAEIVASLANPALHEEVAARPVSGVTEARTARALREQPNARLSQPEQSPAEARWQDGRNGDPRLVETRADGRRAEAQTFDAEMPSASVRALLKSAADDASMAGRLSLPMGSWADTTEAEDSRVTPSMARPSLPQPVPANEPMRPSQVGLPAPKPSVKELLARRSVAQPGTQQQDTPGRGSKVSGELGTTNAGSVRLLSLPTFAARGSSLADEIEELAGALELRRRLSITTWTLLLLASVATAGLFAAWITFKIVGQRRRRLVQLCELQASALLVGQAQLPELYNCVKQLAIRLEISPSPRLYVAERCPRKVQSFVQRGGLVIVLDADLLSRVARFDAGYIVQFALAHEMAAYALEQHSWTRQTLAWLWARARKSDLLSADALASKLMTDRNEPVRALASLLCGPELAHLVDLGELERQTTSQEQEAKAHGDNIEDSSYLLPRIQHLRRLLLNGK